MTIRVYAASGTWYVQDFTSGVKASFSDRGAAEQCARQKAEQANDYLAVFSESGQLTYRGQPQAQSVEAMARQECVPVLQ